MPAGVPTGRGVSAVLGAVGRRAAKVVAAKSTETRRPVVRSHELPPPMVERRGKTPVVRSPAEGPRNATSKELAEPLCVRRDVCRISSALSSAFISESRSPSCDASVTELTDATRSRRSLALARIAAKALGHLRAMRSKSI